MTQAKTRTARRMLPRGKTRQSLIEEALALLDGDKSFDGLSLRELTREVGIVPTAFYRHFPGMDELGLALVEESFRALRQILDDVRKELKSETASLSAIVRSLVKQVQKHRRRFRFMAAERYGGNAGVRAAIRREMRLVHSELAVDLARLPAFREWSVHDLHMLGGLLVNSMVAIAEDILDQSPVDKHLEKDLMQLAEKQLRLIFLGVPHWRSSD